MKRKKKFDRNDMLRFLTWWIWQHIDLETEPVDRHITEWLNSEEEMRKDDQ